MFDDYCRICGLSQDEAETIIYPLFGSEEEDEVFTIDGKMFVDCLFDLDIGTVGYPKYLCGPCHLKLSEFYEFRKVAILTHEKISEILSTDDAVDIDMEVDNMEKSKPDIDELASKEMLVDPEMFKDTLNGSFEIKNEIDYILKNNIQNFDTLLHQDDIKTVDNLNFSPNNFINKLKLNNKALDGYTESIKAIDNEEILLDFNNEFDETIPYIDSLSDIELNNVSADEDLTINNKVDERQPINECKFCDRTFTSLVKLRKHKKTKHTTCKFCSRKFLKFRNLKSHLEKNHCKPLCCKFCGENFKLRRSLTEHESTHKNVRESKCYMCDKKFRLLFDLQVHMNEHYNEPKCICDICGHENRNKSDMLTHMKIHSDEPVIKCDLCKLKLRKSSFKIHMKDEHEIVGKYICLICKVAYASKCHLKRHLKSHVKDGTVAIEEIAKYIWIEND